jgi:hypothetical protein
MSNILKLKTEHYMFEIEVTDNKLHDKIISKYFLLGNDIQPCLSFILYTKEAEEILGKDVIYTANLMNIERLKECIINEVSDEYFEKYSSNIELLNAFLKYIKKTYPYIKEIKLNDKSYIPCNKEDTLDLLSYYIALYGKTWYEDKYKAYSKNNYSLYKEQIKNYISKEFKSKISWDLFYVKYILLANNFTKNIINNNISICKDIYEKSNTFPDFFNSINKKVEKKYKCYFFKSWLENFISDNIKVSREWYIPLQQFGGNLKDRRKRMA